MKNESSWGRRKKKNIDIRWQKRINKKLTSPWLFPHNSHVIIQILTLRTVSSNINLTVPFPYGKLKKRRLEMTQKCYKNWLKMHISGKNRIRKSVKITKFYHLTSAKRGVATNSCCWNSTYFYCATGWGDVRVFWQCQWFTQNSSHKSIFSFQRPASRLQNCSFPVYIDKPFSLTLLFVNTLGSKADLVALLAIFDKLKWVEKLLIHIWGFPK